MGSVRKKTAGAVGAFLIFATFEVLALPVVRTEGLRGYELGWAGLLILYSLGAFLVFLEWQKRGEDAERQTAPPPVLQRPILVEETAPPPVLQRPILVEETAPPRREIQPEEPRRLPMRAEELEMSEFEYQANTQARRRQAQLQRQHVVLKRG